MMDARAPIYSFERPEPKEHGSTLKPLLIALVVFVVIIVALAIVGNHSEISNVSVRPVTAPQQQMPPRAELSGTRPVACPPQFRSNRGTGFERCLAVDLPGSGEWVRRVSTSDAWEMPLTPNVQARGCGGEVYSLGSGGNRIDESCGYLDYRVTDARPRTIIEGHNPVAPQQAKSMLRLSDWEKGFDYGRAGGKDVSCIAPAGIVKPFDWGMGCQSGRHSTGQ